MHIKKHKVKSKNAIQKDLSYKTYHKKSKQQDTYRFSLNTLGNKMQIKIEELKAEQR